MATRHQTTEQITQDYLDSIRSLMAQLPADIAGAEAVELQAVLAARNTQALPHGATDHQLAVIETRLQKRVMEYKVNER